MSFKEKIKKCNPLAAILIALVIVLITAISVLIALRFIGKTEAKKRKVCTTPECLALANQLHSWADPEADPCVDFYKSTCGRYTQTTMGDGIIDEKSQIIKNLMREFLRKTSLSALPSEQAMRTLHQQCENWKSTIQQEKDDVVKIIRQIGTWPLADPTWDDSKFNFNKMLVKMTQLSPSAPSSNGFFEVAILGKSVLIGPVEPSMLEIDLLTKMVGELLKIMGVSVNQMVLQKDIQDVQMLAEKLAANLVPLEGILPFAELKSNLRNVAIEEMLKASLDPEGVYWDKLLPMISAAKTNLFSGQGENLENILETTEKRVLANYFIFHYIKLWYESLDEKQSLGCEGFVASKLPQAAHSFFFRRYFDRENFELVGEIVESLKASYVEMFEKSNVISDKTRQAAIKKAKQVAKTVHPEGWEKVVETRFQKLKLEPTDTGVVMLTKTARFRMDADVQNALSGAPVGMGSNHLSPNAFYVRIANYLGIMTSLIDDPSFDATFPKYAKIAATGGVLGHEIGHGFDRNGIQYDEKGVHRDWWDPKDKDGYQKRTECLVKQYDNYDDPVFGKNLKGLTTINEMIPDLLGVTNSWRLYKKADMSEEQALLGFEDYSVDKLFFRLSSLMWCSPPPAHPLALQLQQKHPVHRFRVNGNLANFAPFAEAFNCPVGSPMSPADKCPAPF